MRMLSSAAVIGCGALLLCTVGAHPAVANHYQAAAGGRHHVGQLLTYSIEPDNDAPTIQLARPDGSRSFRVDWPVQGAVISRISSSGTHLVAATFAAVGAIRPGVSRLDGSHFRRLVVSGVPSDADVSPCIWATRQALLCEVRSPSGRIDGIYRVDVRDRHKPVRLTVTPYPPSDDFGGGDIPGDLSPDGRHFVFVRSIPLPPPENPDASQSGALYVGNVDGSGVRRITRWGLPNSHDTGFESWGSHRRGIVFGTESGAIATLRPDGSRIHKLDLDIPPDSYAYAPTWAPAGARIAFGLYPAPDYQSDIYLASMRTGHLRQLTNTPEVDDAPDWKLVHRAR